MENLQADQGIIWKIDRFAQHDGPGIRTNFYFKGCALRCQWCENPEGQTSVPELVLFGSRCNGCGLCVERCPHQAIELQDAIGTDRTNLRINRPKCDLCEVCVPVCPKNALEIWGRKYSIEELAEILEKDRGVHRRSGGGLTCTGGDPLHQSGFTLKLLKLCRKRGIHTGMETCGDGDEESFRVILEEVDWLCIDLKHMNRKDHLLLTGKSNDRILRNLRLASSRLAARQKSLVIRMVVVPGANDENNIVEMADFLSSLPFVTEVELLPYHAYGVHKYDLLDRSYKLKDVIPPSSEAMARYRTVLESRGLRVTEELQKVDLS
ncbi:MAG: glycyl-radical enzyme activating protein [Thermodesulfobacteriota bacterium]